MTSLEEINLVRPHKLEYGYTFGELYLHIICIKQQVVSITLSQNKAPSLAIVDWIKKPLDDYFYGQQENVALPYQLNVTTYQQRVLTALNGINCGETKTYQDISEQIGSHPRAVGQALKRNPLPLIFPCHRVVSKKDIGGFMGETHGSQIEIKKQLLALERQ